MGTRVRLKDRQDEFVQLYAKRNNISISDANNQLIAIAMESIEAGNLDFYEKRIKAIVKESLKESEETTGDIIIKRFAGLIALNTNYTLKGFSLIKDMFSKLLLFEYKNWDNFKDTGLAEEVKKLIDEIEKSAEGYMRAIYENSRKVKQNVPPQQ